jgi:hypothetical protein
MNKENLVKRCKGLPLLLALLVFPLVASAAVSGTARQQVLVIVSGSDSVAFALTDAPVITYEGNNLVVKSLGDSLVADLAGVRYFFEERSIADNTTTAINNVTLPGIGKEKPQMGFADGMVSGLRAGDVVRVYRINGTLVKTVKADTQGHAALELSQLPNGVYIIKTPNNSIKIINR